MAPIAMPTGFQSPSSQMQTPSRSGMSTPNSSGMTMPAPQMFPKGMMQQQQLSLNAEITNCLTARTGTVPKVYGADFEILGRLGEGAHSTVFMARYRPTGKILALKRFNVMDRNGHSHSNPNAAVADPMTMALALVSEVQMIMRVGKHPNVVATTSVCVDEVSYAMECAKADLGSIICQFGENLTMDAISQITLQMAKGVAHIHKMGVLHLDLKASNIMVTDMNNVKIGDFGNSRMCPGASSGGSLPANFEMITIWYRPPELLMGAKIVTAKADVWGVACIVMEMLNGKHPFGQPKFSGAGSPCHPNYNGIMLSAIFETLGMPAGGMQIFADMPAYGHFCHMEAKPSTLGFMIAEGMQRRFRAPNNAGNWSWWLAILNAIFEYRPEHRLTAKQMVRMMESSSKDFDAMRRSFRNKNGSSNSLTEYMYTPSEKEKRGFQIPFLSCVIGNSD